MRKILAWIFCVGVCAPVIAADTGVPSRAIPSLSNSSDALPQTSRATGTTGATGATSAAGAVTDLSDVATRTTASRVAVRSGVVGATGAAGSTGADGDAMVSRVVTRTPVVAGNTSPDTSRAVTPSRGSVARSVNNTNTSARSNLDAAVHTVGRNARVNAASVNSTAAVRRAGVVLRPSTAEVGGRAKIAGTNVQTGSNISSSLRGTQTRAATTVVNRETIADAKERLEQTAELNKSCQEQYNECMDQFCAVIDSNQKRCSCSANLSRYSKAEDAVKNANNQLNDVAQRIRYVGLSADEIRAILSATEAEQALSGSRDTSETRGMLADIEAMIKDPTASNTFGTDGFSMLDLNLDFSDTTDLFNLDFLNGNNANSISNMRGTNLYNAAKKRCQTIITQCKDAGATQQQITSNYDLAIDKDCIAYEQGLTKMNETLLSNVRSANLMLQKARLTVLQNQNEYDAKGCVAALDACMTDEMVCGADYLKCLDPTKKYIDENGKVVLGQDITQIRKQMSKYDNSAIDKGFLTTSNNIKITANDNVCTGNGGDGSCAVKYLLTKIGTSQKATDGGLCRPVLDKCQRYTYDTNKTYMAYNDIVVNYIQRAMVNIKSGQEKIISDYASNCMVDVATCYNQQVTQVNTWTTAARVASIKNVMSGACRNVAQTCGYAIFDGGLKELIGKYDNCTTKTGELTPGCNKTDDDGKAKCTTDDLANAAACMIDGVSDIFYQSMLCPDYSTYGGKDGNETKDSAGDGVNWVNDLCRCNDGYEVYLGACVVACGTGFSRNSYGTCTCDALKGYITDGNGGCKCPAGYTSGADGYCNPTNCPGDGKVAKQGGCICNIDKGWTSNSDGNCVCDAKNGWTSDNAGNCVCDTINGWRKDQQTSMCVCNVADGWEPDNEKGGCKCKNGSPDGNGVCTSGGDD